MPSRDDERQVVPPGATASYFESTYGIEGEVVELMVPAESALIGLSIAEVEALSDTPLILAIKVGEEARLAPPADQMLWANTILGVLGPRERIHEWAQQQGLRVDRARLAVHEGQVGKRTLRHGQRGVVRARHHFLCQGKRQRVARKSARIVPVDVARELVEHDDFRQTPARRGAPGRQLAALGRLQKGAKALGDARVQGSVFGEMLLRCELAKPEVEHVLCVRGGNISQIGLQRFMNKRRKLSK